MIETTSLSTLSPKTSEYMSKSTLASLKIVKTVTLFTIKHIFDIYHKKIIISYLPGSVAEIMAPKKKQSLNEK